MLQFEFSTPPITSFSGEHRFLSNFYPCSVVYNGIIFTSVEHAYVAAKTIDNNIQLEIAKISSPGKVKRFGRDLKLRPDWDQVKVGVMRELIRQKFQDPELKQMLVSTGDAELVEGNHWGDMFWGVCGGTGRNVLGNLLMEIRNELV